MKKVWLKTIFLFFFTFFFHQIILKNVYAAKYRLFGPSSETLTRGQTVTFTIKIDTLGETINSAAIRMDYETQYLEYINTIPGDAFPSLTTTPQEGGKLIFQASSSGFNGSDTFAQVNFKIIADAPGSSQLCILWEVPQTPSNSNSQTPSNSNSQTPSNSNSQTPSNSNSQTPSNSNSQTPSNSNSQTPSNSNSQNPSTQLPTSGQTNSVFIGLIIASIFIASASIAIIAYKKLSFEPKLVLKKTFSDGSKNKQLHQQ